MTDDLSRFHHPITDLFPRAGDDAQRRRHRLTNDQIEFFHTHGYLAGVRILDDAQVDALRAELAQLTDPNTRDARTSTNTTPTNRVIRRQSCSMHSVPGELLPASTICSGIRPFLFRRRNC